MDEIQVGDFFAVRWRTTSGTEIGEQSPGFRTLDEARAWVGQYQNYVIRRRIDDGNDERIEKAGVVD